jgi:hypothetical protein
MTDNYEKCCVCHQWVHMRDGSYDVILDEDGQKHIVHHHHCSNRWFDAHYGEIIETHVAGRTGYG